MATLTINTTSAQDARILAAFREFLGPDATGAEIKQWIIEQMKGVVRDFEARQAIEAANITDIEPT